MLSQYRSYCICCINYWFGRDLQNVILTWNEWHASLRWINQRNRRPKKWNILGLRVLEHPKEYSHPKVASSKKYLNIFINSKTPWIVYRHLPMKIPCASTSLTFLQTPQMTPFHTSEVSLVYFLVREGKHYAEILFISCCQEMSRYH